MLQNNPVEWDQLSGDIADLLKTEGRLAPDAPEQTAATQRHRTALFRRAATLLGIAAADRPDPASMPPVTALTTGTATGTADDLFVLKSPRSPRVADLRRVAQTLAMRWFLGETRHSALSVISADRREGRSSVAANLACIFAQSGVSTLLIDADLHNPMIHTKFDLAPPRQAGTIHRAVNGVDNLSVVPAPILLELKYDRFMQSALHALVEAMRADFKVIFVDTAAASSSNDYQMAALATGGALCVTREGVTRARRAARVLDLCEDAGIAVVGGVMLKA